MKKILILFFAFVFLSGCAEKSYVTEVRPLLGTIVEIAVADKDKPAQVINAAIDQAFTEIKRVEDLLNRFRPDSEVSQINTYASLQPVKASPETLSLLEKSRQFSRLSGGAFDITIYPLMEIWGLAGKNITALPTSEQIKSALEKVGEQNIVILKEEQAVSLARPGMSLDLGGIAKGYAVDRAILVLRRSGIRHALVNAGGDIYALGRPGKNQKWQVGLQHPRKKSAILTLLKLEDEAVATSGDYQKYIEIEGRRFSHIINPQTGWPCQDTPASVTVLAKDCLTADALATAVFVLGPEKGLDLINQLEDSESVIVNFQQGKLDILPSRGLEGKVKFNQD